MSCYVGFDTSNYTTSVAVCVDGNIVSNEKIVLEVKKGERGLRQSDALFQHICNLPVVAGKIGKRNPDGMGVSVTPRDESGSYMPVFRAGECVASVTAGIIGCPLFKFSHQAGHVAAAAYSAGMTELIFGKMNVFHVSGGTTEILLCDRMNITNTGKTLDLNAGQAIDRAGVLLGLKFPCGKELEKLSQNGTSPEIPKVCVNNLECNFSGLENKVLKFKSTGISDEDIAKYTIEFVGKTLDKLSENLRKEYTLPILYAGGVMSNKYIQTLLGKRENTFFAQPEYSCDNAAGIALLAYLKGEGKL